jgi:hypothetical protein
VEFSMSEPGAVRLEAFDVAGRLAWRRDEHQLGAGLHVLKVDALKPGLYFLRLSQASRTATARAVVIR